MHCHRFAMSFVLLAATVALGAEDNTFYVGWRGDGLGHFPAAQPPLTWSKNAKGETKGIAWQVRMPCYSFGSLIVVGEKLFIRSEPYDPLCMDKKTGKVLWVRAHGPHEVISEEDRKGPLWPDVQAAAKELDRVNAAIYAAPADPKELLLRKLAVEKQLNDLAAKIGRQYKVPPELWRGKWSGYTGSTPCSDGKNIYFVSCMGVVGCYDLDGNRKWMRLETMTAANMGEHGNGCSPKLVGDLFIYCLKGTVNALDKNTGQVRWSQQYDGGDPDPSIMSFCSGEMTYLLAKQHFIRPADGSDLGFRDEHAMVMSDFATPVTHEDAAYWLDSAGRLFWLKWQVGGAGSLKISRAGLLQFPIETEEWRWNNEKNFWVASPLYLDGLAYCLSNQGRMVIVDVSAGKIVYDKVLDLDVDIYKSGKHGGYIVGSCSSPTLAGKHLFVMDNRGNTLVMEPGPQPKVVARNSIEQIVQPWDPKHWDNPHQECTLATPFFDGTRIYHRAELYTYCIGEP